MKTFLISLFLIFGVLLVQNKAFSATEYFSEDVNIYAEPQSNFNPALNFKVIINKQEFFVDAKVNKLKFVCIFNSNMTENFIDVNDNNFFVNIPLKFSFFAIKVNMSVKMYSRS